MKSSWRKEKIGERRERALRESPGYNTMLERKELHARAKS